MFKFFKKKEKRLYIHQKLIDQVGCLRNEFLKKLPSDENSAVIGALTIFERLLENSESKIVNEIFEELKNETDLKKNVTFFNQEYIM